MKENNFVLKSASDVSSFIINLATKTIKSKEANVVVKLRKQKVSLKLKPSKELFRQNLLDYFHCKQSDIIAPYRTRNKPLPTQAPLQARQTEVIENSACHRLYKNALEKSERAESAKPYLS